MTPLTSLNMSPLYLCCIREMEPELNGHRLSVQARQGIIDACECFLVCCRLLGINTDTLPLKQTAYDLWLTRNGHGVGFWDRPELYGQDVADKLTRIAEEMGSQDIYPGDDGLLYLI